MKKYRQLLIRYGEAFKQGLTILCTQLRLALAEMAEALRRQGHIIGGVGYDKEYVVNCLRFVSNNPLSSDAKTVFRDAERIKCGSCQRCSSTVKEPFFQMVHAPRRNCDIGR